MAKGKKRTSRKPTKRAVSPPPFSFSVNDRRTADELFPAHWAASAAGYYTDEFIESTARKFKIEGAQLEIFKRFLGVAAGLYLPSTKALTEERQQITTRKKLTAIADAHRKFSELLDNLSTLERDRLWCPLWEDPSRPPRLIGLADRTAPRPFPDEAPFLKELGTFGKRIQARLVDLQNIKDRGGRPKRMDVRVFVTVARDFWVKVLGRQFTFHAVDGGMPKSNVFEFCRHVLRPLDPDVTDAELVTAVRRAVKSANPTVRFYPS